ncbi:MAG: ubiquinone biosynthesis accessory factor UbiJ, partial [Luminiphilus sp.]
LINSDLEILGNTSPLLALQALVSRMQPDWEAPLVEALGDVAGHQLANLLRGIFRWGQASSKSLRRQLSEFILEEGQLSPPAAELEHFFEQVTALGLRVDRLESRLQRLARRLATQR